MKIRLSTALSTIMVSLFLVLCLTALSHGVQFMNTNWFNSENLFADGISANWLYPGDSFWVTTSYPWASFNQVYGRFDLYQGVHDGVFDSYINLLNYRNIWEPAWHYSRNWEQSNYSFYQNYPLYSALNYISGYLLSWRYPFGFKKTKPKPSGAQDAYNPVIDPAHFVEIIDNPYWPLTPGTTYTYLGETEEGAETTIVEVLEDIRQVMGVTCTVVRDRVYLDGELIEDTHDWYAQDDDGNVWYFGEDSREYEVCEEEEDEDDDECISTTGSWEASVDGALPGIIMKAQPQVGVSYRQEYYKGEAEDMAEVIALNIPVTLSDGSQYTCLKTREWTPLEPDVNEYKYYAAGIGLVLEETVDGEERVELKGIFHTGVGTIPDVGAATFSNPTTIDNSYWALSPGTTYSYLGETEDGPETIVIEVLDEIRQVMGITCTVVRDRVYLDGELIEDTHDWYAQDDEGNVWYMGEEVDNYNYDDEGVLIDITHEGAWEAGVDGALPGIIMKAQPQVGESYRQEYYEGEAEDMAVVISLGASVELEDGTTYYNCLQTLEWTPLEPDALEYKYYAPGIGLVMEEPVCGEEGVELQGIESP